MTGDAESAYRAEPEVSVAPAASQKLPPVMDYLATGTRERDTMAERAEEEVPEMVKARMIPPQGNDPPLATAQLAPRGPAPAMATAALHKYDSI